MSYSLIYTQRAIKDIRKLDADVRRRIGRTLKRYEEDPIKFSSKLTDPRMGTYRFRVGDYRVVFDIEENDIVVLRVGHRKDIYRKL
ncbi:MAG: type II toxin-antitoxin system RelE/ParE family toxin [Deltaproteobacteria bacterium]|nr:type II toxin-antitoxin system RelE/ParE family toxin [Deltaproteobacteria bacterium]